MPIMTDGPTMEPQNKSIEEFHVGRGESLGATASQAFSDSPTAQLFNLTQTDRATGDAIDFGQVATGMPTPGMAEEKKAAQDMARIDIIDANDRVKKAGLAPHLKLPDQPDIHPAQLEIMMSRAQARREREATIERGPQSYVQTALDYGTSFAVGAIDPLNLAAAFVPVMGELRYAKILASTGDGFFGRAAVRAGVGAAEGALGQAAMEPLDWYSHTQDGRDFGMSDVLHNVLFGAVLGGSLHAGGGAVSDIYRARKERPVYPYDLGEPLESHTPWEDLRAGAKPPPIPRDILGVFPGTHVRGGSLAEDGITPEALEAHFNEAAQGIEPHDPAAHEPIFPESPDDAHVTPAALSLQHRATLPDVPSAAVQTIDDLPQRAREDAARAGIANLIDGEPLRVGEMLETAAQHDPRIAESFVHSVMPKITIGGKDIELAGERIINREELAILRSEFNRLKARLDIGDITEAELRRLDQINKRALGRANDDFKDVVEQEPAQVVQAIDALGRAVSARDAVAAGDVAKSRTVHAEIDRARDDLRRETGVMTHDEIETISKADPRYRAEAVRAGQFGEMANIIERDLPAAREGRSIMGAPVDDVATLQRRLAELAAALADHPADRPAAPAAPAAQALDRDAAWRRLAQATPDFDEPAAIAASNAAAEVKPPPSKLDDRLTAAQKADAYAKQMYDMFADRLPEGDRQRLDDLIKTIDDDHHAREIAIRQGGACLFGARA